MSKPIDAVEWKYRTFHKGEKVFHTLPGHSAESARLLVDNIEGHGNWEFSSLRSLNIQRKAKKLNLIPVSVDNQPNYN